MARRRWLRAIVRKVLLGAAVIACIIAPAPADSDDSPSPRPPTRSDTAPPSAHSRARIPRLASALIPTPVVDCELQPETGYRRGKPFPIEVLRIDGDLVERRTAAAYWAMREAARADGVELVIYSGFRTNDEQRYFYGCYRRCNCNDCNLAARPGYSNHQSGYAIDIGMDEGVHEWLLANARRFGFKATVRSEPWHWEYRAGLRPDKSAWPAICPGSQ